MPSALDVEAPWLWLDLKFDEKVMIRMKWLKVRKRIMGKAAGVSLTLSKLVLSGVFRD